MATYAEAWNQKWSGPLSSGPTRITVDGLNEEWAEEEELMDVEDPADYLLHDVDTLVLGIQNERLRGGALSSDDRYGLDGWEQEMMEVDSVSLSSLVKPCPEALRS